MLVRGLKRARRSVGGRLVEEVCSDRDVLSLDGPARLLERGLVHAVGHAARGGERVPQHRAQAVRVVLVMLDTKKDF